jgi:ribosomal protein L7Ae-like RNA K-turn-binding protein
MSVKEIRDAIKEGNVCFGVRQAIKLGKVKKNVRVFISKDCRDETIDLLEGAGIEFEVLKTKEQISKDLNLDFESEVFSISEKKAK